jgi:CelD/BcsL family acetyltransferase involved in cellulose biosynthesis
MTDMWVDKPLQFRFLLGEFPLFSMTFTAKVLDVHFTRLSSIPDDPRPPIGEFAGGWDAAVILAHPVVGRLPRLALLQESIRYVPREYDRRLIDLRGTFQDYLKKFSRERRHKLRWQVQRAERLSHGAVRWNEYRTPEEILEFYGHAREVSQHTWQKRLLRLGLPDQIEFQSEVATLAAQDAVRGYVLFDGDKPIAFIYARTEAEGTLVFKLTGYDPQYRSWSPGNVLLYLVIERLFCEGKFRTFDMAEGEDARKIFFSTAGVRCADIYYFRRTLKNLCLVGLHAGICSLSRIIVSMLKALGLRDRAKKFFRRIA